MYLFLRHAEMNIAISMLPSAKLHNYTHNTDENEKQFLLVLLTSNKLRHWSISGQHSGVAYFEAARQDFPCWLHGCLKQLYINFVTKMSYFTSQKLKISANNEI